MSNTRAEIRVLLLGDLVGLPGFGIAMDHLAALRRDMSLDFVVVNVENAASSGQGVTLDQIHGLRAAGADVLTTGNHVWESESLEEILHERSRVLRPDNYPSSMLGRGWCVVESGPVRVGMINLQGRSRMAAIDDPFVRADQLVTKIREQTPLIFVDFHAESPDEKEAMGFWLDGRVTAVLGTHTHVATRDTRILPKGTAFQTDLGYGGVIDSVIGGDSEASVERALTLIPHRMPPASGPARLQGALVVADSVTGHALSVERWSL